MKYLQELKEDIRVVKSELSNAIFTAKNKQELIQSIDRAFSLLEKMEKKL